MGRRGVEDAGCSAAPVGGAPQVGQRMGMAVIHRHGAGYVLTRGDGIRAAGRAIGQRQHMVDCERPIQHA